MGSTGPTRCSALRMTCSGSLRFPVQQLVLNLRRETQHTPTPARPTSVRRQRSPRYNHAPLDLFVRNVKHLRALFHDKKVHLLQIVSCREIVSAEQMIGIAFFNLEILQTTVTVYVFKLFVGRKPNERPCGHASWTAYFLNDVSLTGFAHQTARALPSGFFFNNIEEYIHFVFLEKFFLKLKSFDFVNQWLSRVCTDALVVVRHQCDSVQVLIEVSSETFRHSIAEIRSTTICSSSSVSSVTPQYLRQYAPCSTNVFRTSFIRSVSATKDLLRSANHSVVERFAHGDVVDRQWECPPTCERPPGCLRDRRR